MTDDEKRKRLRILELEKAKSEAEAAAAQESIPAPGAEASVPAPMAAEESNTLAPDSTMGAAARGFAQGGTFGFADEAGGVLGAADELARRAFGSGGEYADKPLRQALVERYLLERNANRQELAEARAARPFTVGAAELAGGLAVPIPGAGAAGALGARALKVAPNVGRFAAQGALAGGLMGLGAGEDLGDVAKGAAMGAGSGALLGPAVSYLADKVTPTAAEAAEKLRNIARTRALKTVMIQKDLKKIPLEQQQKIADYALDSGAIEPWDNAANLAPKFQAAKDDAGEGIGAILGGIDDDMAAKAGLPDGRLSTIRKEVAERRASDKEWVDADAALQQERAAAAREAEELQRSVAEARQRSGKEFMQRQLEDDATSYDMIKEVGNIEMATTDAQLKALADKLPPGPERSAAIRALVERRILSAPFNPRTTPAGTPRVLTMDELRAIASSVPPGTARAAAIRDAMAKKAQATQPPESLAPATEDEILEGLGVPMKDAISMIRRDVLPLFDDPALARQQSELRRLLDGYEAQAARGVSLKKAASFKSNLQKTISRFSDTPAAQEARLNAQRVLDDFVEGQVLKQTNSPDALREYVDLKGKYGAFKELSKRAKEAIDRDTGNRAISPSDYGAVGSSLIAGSTAAAVLPSSMVPYVTIGAGVLHNQVRRRGSSTAAFYSDRLSKYLRAAPSERSPAMNFMLEEYGPTLRAFAARGPAAAATAYYLMSQKDQRFRELDEQAQKEVTER